MAYFGLCFAATFDTSYSDVLPVARRPLTFYMISPPMVLLLFFGSMWAIAPLLKQE